ncbi:MAG: UMP kinase [Candidatus Krumholzibacteria bacterium]|nr:UMP kinase [Candidatus Krumholzibacteria bacterium]
MKFTRILLKLSGEALMSDDEQYCHRKLTALAQAIAQVTEMGVQVGIVVGAGNIFRARSANLEIVDRVTADNVGMLATIMNGAIVRDYLRGEGLQSRVLSPREQRPLTKSFARDEALELMNRGHVLIFAGGTGNPYFTTDSAAALRALEISADALIKGTQVDGVYDKDPNKFDDAKRYEVLDYGQVIDQRLQVMDLTAVTLCEDQGLPMFVFDISDPNNLVKVIEGTQTGTWIKKES